MRQMHHILTEIKGKRVLVEGGSIGDPLVELSGYAVKNPLSKDRGDKISHQAGRSDHARLKKD
jgi:hypothetical protein